jgi:cytoskeletal protein CcmA (bactofilin family)
MATPLSHEPDDVGLATSSAFLSHNYLIAFVGALLLWFGYGDMTCARTAYDNVKTPEGWAWSRIRQKEVADFNELCGTTQLDPNKNEDTLWQAYCRKISSRFLEDLLTRSPWRDVVPRAGISIVGARVVGDVDLENAKLIRSLWIEGSRIEGKVNLRRTQTDSPIGLGGSLVNGDFIADHLHSESDLFFGSGLTVKGAVELEGATITGEVDMDGANFEGDLNADSLQVGNNLHMRSTDKYKASFKNVILRGAKVSGQVVMDGATFEGDLNADALQVGDSLFMRSTDKYKASFKNVILGGARVSGQVAMDGATFEGDLNADSLQVGTHLFMGPASFKNVSLASAKVTGELDMSGATFEGDLNADSLQVGPLLLMNSTDKNKTSFKNVTLRGANVTGQVAINGATFEGDLNAGSLQVGDSLFMRSTDKYKASFKNVFLRGAKIAGQLVMDGASFEGDLDGDSLEVGSNMFMRSTDQNGSLVFAQIGGNLDLRGAILHNLDLSGASVTGDFRLGATAWTPKNGRTVELNLRNTRVGNLMDANDAWPAKGQIRLDGFTFARLGGFTGDTGQEMRVRGTKWWDQSWARLDPRYSPTPYAQLAAAFIAAGDRDAANEIRYLGRVREQETESGMTYIWSSFLRWVAGFGIGSYTFRVVYWVFGIAFLGALYLRTRVRGVRAGHHGFPWCFGASLARLLPIIEINEEFTAFFDDPKRERLTGWQSFVFSGISVVGWLLGLMLLAAVSGVTQNS